MDSFDIHTHRIPPCPEQAIYTCSPFDTSLPHEIVHHSIGIHPWHLTEDNAEEQLRRLAQAIRQPGVVAIGECGIDRLRGISIDKQLHVFKKCAELSEQTSLPLIIHAVKCTTELIRLKRSMTPRQPWIIHGFRSRREVAEEYLSYGFHLSFGSRFQEDSVRTTPLHRLFIETDESEEGIGNICRRIAEIKGISSEEMTEAINKNVREVFFKP